MRKRVIVLIALLVLSLLVFSQEALKEKESSSSGEQSIQSEEPEKPLEGKIIFLNFGTFSVGLINEGKVVDWNLTSLTATYRGTGKAVLAGLTGGLAGAAAVPAIMAANANGLKPKEIYNMLSFFPNGESFFLTSPLTNKSFKCDLKGKKEKKYKFGGCDPEILPDGKTLFIASLASRKNGKIFCYDLENGKQIDFSIEGKERQWWPRHSPDLQKMVFLEGNYDESNLILYDLQKKEKKVLVSKEMKPVHPCWYPDGSSIVYCSLSDRQLHKINLSSGEDTILTESPYFKLYPSVSYDGKKILFSQAMLGVRSGSVGGKFRLKWIDLEGKRIYTVPLGKEPNYLSIVDVSWMK